MSNLKLYIPNPCSEKWQNMTPTHLGKHCDLCVKTVVDFTKMNPEEIKVFFENKTEDKICGRFRANQLNNNYLRINVSKSVQKLGLASILFLAPFSVTFAQDSNNIKQRPTIIEEVIGITEESAVNNHESLDSELMGDVDIIHCGDALDENLGSVEHPFPFFHVEERAVFPGGQETLFKNIKENIGEGPFPIEEKIFVSFVIDSAGYCLKPRVIRGLNPVLKEKAIQIVLNLPQWQPACHNNKPVAMKYTIPLFFKNKE
ncbi:MAG: energy transducer TonB [Flavobacteriales bacterium]